MQRLLPLIIGLLLLSGAGQAWSADDPTLDQRLELWPEWQLPAPLPRPGRHSDLVYPSWFEGEWTVSSMALDSPDDDSSPLEHKARFIRRGGAVVGDRAFNAIAVGQAVLGSTLLTVEQPEREPNRQLARLRGDRLLETTVIGRRQSDPNRSDFVSEFLSDELVLQILHGPEAPRISRVETLSRYQPCAPASRERICADQWQARYSGPDTGLNRSPESVHRYRLELTRLQDRSASAGPPTDPSNGTNLGGGGGH